MRLDAADVLWRGRKNANCKYIYACLHGLMGSETGSSESEHRATAKRRRTSVEPRRSHKDILTQLKPLELV